MAGPLTHRPLSTTPAAVDATERTSRVVRVDGDGEDKNMAGDAPEPTNAAFHVHNCQGRAETCRDPRVCLIHDCRGRAMRWSGPTWSLLLALLSALPVLAPSPLALVCAAMKCSL